MSLLRLYSTAKLSAYFALGSLLFCILLVCSHLGSMALPTSALAAHTSHASINAGPQHHSEPLAFLGEHAGHSMSDTAQSHAEHDCCGQNEADHSLVKWVTSVLLLLAVAGLVWAMTRLFKRLSPSLSLFSQYLKPDPPGGYPPLYLQVQRLRN
ncbi:hypothetical protein [Corallincola spongiicola]|uniref:DUF2946 domain-containing protein n=1 Tax=Corallincola spongiicola TaxID=2520508 RepID=A0ABY1WUY5_9GAMM|nr:hypothetical protein [Corallincola spongiicola]TAA48544.1 hypothetical protein EXY25_04805 [Corallincola spongiicola]